MWIRRRAIHLAVAAAAIVLLATGCESIERMNEDRGRVGLGTELLGTPTATATARLAAAPGSLVEGRVSFAQFDAIVVVRANFFGLAPNREYGLHVHEKGDCSGAAGEGPGGHFNPGGTAHGQPGKPPHHAGDMPNVRTDGEGSVTYMFDTKAFSITVGPTGVLGRSIIISRDRDDYRTQPDGNSGAPLACGFIRAEGGAFGVPVK